MNNLVEHIWNEHKEFMYFGGVDKILLDNKPFIFDFLNKNKIRYVYDGSPSYLVIENLKNNNN